MSGSYEIPVRIFVQLSSLEDLDLDKELSESNDTDFEITKDSICKEFDQQLNDLARDLGQSKRTPSIKTE